MRLSQRALSHWMNRRARLACLEARRGPFLTPSTRITVSLEPSSIAFYENRGSTGACAQRLLSMLKRRPQEAMGTTRSSCADLGPASRCVRQSPVAVEKNRPSSSLLSNELLILRKVTGQAGRTHQPAKPRLAIDHRHTIALSSVYLIVELEPRDVSMTHIFRNRSGRGPSC